MVLREETHILNKKKTRDSLLLGFATKVAGRLSLDDLRRLIKLAYDSKTLKSPDGWLRRVLEAETWHDELTAGP